VAGELLFRGRVGPGNVPPRIGLRQLVVGAIPGIGGDPTGRIGLWSKADSYVYFDDYTVMSADGR